jgi:hypothetical protein
MTVHIDRMNIIKTALIVSSVALAICSSLALAQTACIDTTSGQTVTGSDVPALAVLGTTQWNVGMTVDQTGYSKIIVPADGLYRITGSTSYYNIPDGKHAHLGIALNGTPYRYLSVIHSGAADSLVINLTVPSG